MTIPQQKDILIEYLFSKKIIKEDKPKEKD